ncbi:hypothetical protein EES42_42565 [Streptomyces sp. ADI95-17]|nr:hypothetical protein EES42_42565 [Streptomyces sp. ADI95-17]
MEGLRQDTLPHRHDHLDDAGNAGSRLRVTEVRLDRAEQQRAVARPFLAVRGQQRLRLDGVAQRRTRAVRLDRVDVRSRQARARQRRSDDPLLGRAIGCRQTVGRAVLVDGGAAHDSQHLMAQAPCVGQALHQEHAHALGPARAVGSRRERLAAAVGGEAALAAEVHERARGRHHRHATGQRHRALALAQRLHRQVQGDQGRRAGRVNGHGGAFEPEGVGHAAGDDAARVADADERLDAVGYGTEPGRVVVVHEAREDARTAAAQRRRVDARALERLPGGLQEEPLLRVHRQRLARRDPEEARVEVARPVEEAALFGG